MTDYKNPLLPSGKKKKTWNFTAEQLHDITHAATLEGIKAGVHIGNAALNVAYLTTLRDMDGFGVKRLHDRFEHVQKLFAEIAESRIKYVELAQVLMDECGIELDVQKSDGTKQSVIDMFDEIEQVGKMVMRINK